MIIKNALIYDAVRPEPYKGDIRIADGKLVSVGGAACPEAGEEVYEAEGLRAYPGFVDAHCHVGLDAYGGSSGLSVDYNEHADFITPQLRGMDSYNPMDQGVANALAAGVTTICTGPGSANVLGGTFLAVKTYGRSVDKSVILPAAAMKCAFGENPKRCYMNKGNDTRMSTASALRNALFNARDYMLRKEAAGGDVLKAPKFDMKAEALIPVLKGELPLKAHAHRADDILTAIRIAKEFGVKLTLEHCTEGHLIPEEIAASGCPAAVGPTLPQPAKRENVNKCWETPGILQRAGVRVSIITDAPVTPEEYLPLCAGYAVKAGMDPFAALQAITIRPAEHIGVADRVGTLEAGKDADIVLTDGDPLVSSTAVRAVFVDGEKRA